MYKTIYVPVDNSDHSNTGGRHRSPFRQSSSARRSWAAMSMRPKCMTNASSRWKRAYPKNTTMKKNSTGSARFTIR